MTMKGSPIPPPASKCAAGPCDETGLADPSVGANGVSPTPPSTFLYLLDQYNGDGIAKEADFQDTWGYYDRISAGLPGGVPRTLEAFKEAFSIGRRGVDPGPAGETLEEYRTRIEAAVYYNVNELGLGREMACAPDGFVDTNGDVGQACFVTNYGGGGGAFYDEEVAMNAAIAGTPVKNTVAITFRPSQAGAYADQGVSDGAIQFWVYNQQGELQDYAQLDDLPGDQSSSRSVPSVCTECHGATTAYTRGLVVNGGRFLPANPFAVTHLQGDDIQQRLAAATCASVRTGRLTVPQQHYVEATYDDVCADGSTPKNDAPVEWSSSPGMQDLWKQAVAASCATCHLALDTPVLGEGTTTFLCERMMPHSYPTWLRARGHMGAKFQIEGFDPNGTPTLYDDAVAYILDWSSGGKGCGPATGPKGPEDDQGEDQP
jgi:hypothetical protein